MPIKLPFTKMVGTGNDFIVIDARRHALGSLKSRWPQMSRTWCDRHHGVGADGLLVLESSTRADARMRVFNPDGSEAEMCGNGARCVALYLVQGSQFKVQRGRHVRLETGAGVLSATVRGTRVAIGMTNPTDFVLHQRLSVNGHAIRYGFVNTGVPHVVIPVKDIEDIDVMRVGRLVRHHRAFSPRGTNVNFIEPHGMRPNRLRVRTYERGVEAETLACGTGVVASAMIYALSRQANGKSRRRHIDVETRSGDVLTVSMRISPDADQPSIEDAVLDGPAMCVFEGTVQVPGGPSAHRARHSAAASMAAASEED